jgi:hypothetical protein
MGHRRQHCACAIGGDEKIFSVLNKQTIMYAESDEFKAANMHKHKTLAGIFGG